MEWPAHLPLVGGGGGMSFIVISNVYFSNFNTLFPSFNQVC